MSKRILFTAIAAAAVLAACNSQNPASLFGNPQPTPTGTYVPNPNITAAPLTFTIQGSPVPSQPVSISTPDLNGRPGTPFATQTTSPTAQPSAVPPLNEGQTIFNHLTPTQTYCFVTTYTIPGVGNTPQTYSDCTLFWQGGVVIGT